jgi:glycerophosphoryl diester phosphodiesterase
MLAALNVPGCDGVEFDVRLSFDGVPVVIHDDTLDRVLGVPRRVDELLAEGLAAHGVISLAEVMEALPDAWMDVELKGDRHGAATAAVLRAARGEVPENAVISSFEVPTLIAMGASIPGWPRWLNVTGDLEANLQLAVDLGCRGVSVLWQKITPSFARAAHEAGLEIAAWTVRRRPTYLRLGRLGVVACCVEANALDGPYRSPDDGG